jgi:hypothetical protein
MLAEFARFRGRIISILISWPFLLSLAVLITNDLYLKSAFPSWLTGKLSDVAGIYLLALLITAASPRKKYVAGTILALGFLYWKSPMSQWFIDNVNSVLQAQIGRVVDYSDFLALIAIPFAWTTVSDGAAKPRKLLTQKLLSIPVAVITVLAVSGTSVLIFQRRYGLFVFIR